MSAGVTRMILACSKTSSLLFPQIGTQIFGTPAPNSTFFIVTVFIFILLYSYFLYTHQLTTPHHKQ